MSQYSLFIANNRKRIRHPKTFHLPDVDAARQVALRVAKVFIDVVPYWNDLSPDQQNGFTVQVDDVTGQTVLIVPFAEAMDRS